MKRRYKLCLIFLFFIQDAIAVDINKVSIRKLNNDIERIIINADKIGDVKASIDNQSATFTFGSKVNLGINSIDSKRIANVKADRNKLIINFAGNFRARNFISDDFFGIDLAPPTSNTLSAKTEKSAKPEPKKKIVPKATPKVTENKKIITNKIAKKVEIKPQKIQETPKPKAVQPNNITTPIVENVGPKQEHNKENPNQKDIEMTNKQEIRFYEAGGEINLIFDWKKPVSAALFKRGNNAYIVFGGKSNIPTIPEELDLKLFYFTKDNFTIFRIPTDKYLKVSREQSSWRVILTDTKPFEDVYTVSDTIITRDGKIMYDIPGLLNSVVFVDPVIGDNITVYTVSNDTINVKYPVKKTDFELIQTTLGVALIKKNDKAIIEKIGSKIIITPQSYKKRALEYKSSASLFDFGNWKHVNPNYHNELEKHYNNIFTANIDTQSAERINLAKFFLKNAMTREALSALEYAKIYDSSITNNHDFIVMEPLLYSLNNQDTLAQRKWEQLKLGYIHPKYHNEINMWKAYSNLVINPLYDEKPLNYLAYKDLFLAHYPEEISQKIAIIELEHHISNKNFDDAQKLLNILSENPLPQYKGDISYVNALMEKERGNFDIARSILQALYGNVSDPKNRVRAGFELVKLDREIKNISYDEVSERIKNLLLIWRGDKIEAEILKYYGDFSFENGNYIEAFRAWKNLVEFFPNLPNAISIASEMSKNFLNVITTELGQKMDPVDYASFYFEFRELTPIGVTGDNIVRKVISHLVSLDLLEEAEKLLEHQIKFRSTGTSRNEMIEELAYMYIKDHKPSKAYDILNLPLDATLDYNEERRRRYLKAKALIDSKKHKAALSLLNADLSVISTGIKVDIYWDLKDWAAIKSELNEISEFWASSHLPLTELQEKLIIKLAFAYGMLSDNIAILRLKEQFYNQFRNGIRKEIFAYITNIPEKYDITYIEKHLEPVMADSFLKHYKENINKSDNTLYTTPF